MKKINIILLFLLIVSVIIFLILFFNENKEIKNKNIFSLKLNNNEKNDVKLLDEYVDEGAYYNYNDEINEANVIGTVDTKKIGKYVIKYKSDYIGLNSYNVYRIINVVDTEVPIINLKGEKTITVYVGEKYNEPGFNVIDNSSENLNNKVIITGKVDTKKVGKYVINYEVSDSSKNIAKAKRIINVIKRPIIQMKTNVQFGKKNIVKTISSEKGSINKNKINYNKYPNIITSMHFTNSGINIIGYVKDATQNYIFKLCNQKNCTKFNIKQNKNNYSSTIDLRDIDNGTYDFILSSNNGDNKIFDELSTEEKIVRTKINNKLVTIIYNKDNSVSIKIDNFNYEYDVLIDVGHGGFDSGSSNSYTVEKKINLIQSLYEKKRYEEHGLKVLITRTDDSYGLQIGDSNLPAIRRKALAVGYYGVVSKIVYANHHNSISDLKSSGYEIILTNQGTKNNYSVEYNIANEWSKIYPNLDNHIRIYGRDYDSDAILSKEKGQVYNIKNYYAVQRIPYELFNIYTVTYEGCYLSNKTDYEWYSKNWKKLSEIKIKKYVESLGLTYKEV